VGLISYPIYLLHQPTIVFGRIVFPDAHDLVLLTVVIVICIPFSMLIYRYVETPCRLIAKTSTTTSRATSVVTIALLLIVAGVGGAIAKNNGWAWRLYYLNSFAYSVSNMQKNTFFEQHGNGFLVDESKQRARVLFIGDSIMQQYVAPFAKVLGVRSEDFDIVSGGDCLLLKGTERTD
jgi:hypothetical protein